jgi:hypothetical protein
MFFIAYKNGVKLKSPKKCFLFIILKQYLYIQMYENKFIGKLKFI